MLSYTTTIGDEIGERCGMTKSVMARAVGVVAFLTFVSKILGFFREASLAAVFGSTSDTDAYLVAQTIPYLLGATISYALTTAFIPVYSQMREEQGVEVGSRFATSVIWAVLTVSVLLIGIGEISAEQLVRFVAPGFRGQLADLTTYLSRIILPMMLFQLLSGLFAGILQADGQFGLPTAAGLIQNVSIIVSIVAFGPRYGIKSVAVGALTGAALACVVLVPALSLTRFRWSRGFDLGNYGLRRVGILMLPAIIGAGAGQLNTLVDRMLASGLPEGSVSALNYANRLMQLAPAIIGASVITVVYPTLARLIARNDRRGFTETMVDALGLVHFMLVPVAVGACVLRKPLVRIVFERGAFDAVATEETAWALLFLSIGIAIFTMRDLVGRAYFALQDATTPMILGLVAVGFNIILNLLLVGPLGQGGLALATAAAALIELATGLVVFRRRSPVGFPAQRLLSTVVRTGLAAGVMGVAVWFTHSRIQHMATEAGPFPEIVTVGLTVALGGLVYLAMVLILRVPETIAMINIARRGLGKLRAWRAR